MPHNLDMMHIEKNIVDSIVGMIGVCPEKSKDGLNARKDLQEMGIRKDLHPVDRENGQFYLLPLPMSQQTLHQR